MEALEPLGAEECLARLEASRLELLRLLEGMSDERLFRRPGPGRWSPAEVAEHIALVEESAGKVIRRLRKVALGEAEPFPPAPPGQTRPDGRRLAPSAVLNPRVAFPGRSFWPFSAWCASAWWPR